MIPFSPPKIYPELIDEIVNVLKSGWITTGPRTKQFEKDITNYCENKATLCLNSATAGLEIMLRWYGVKKGDEVIVPVYTYCASANVVVHCGATPILVDVENDFNISLDAIKKAITPKTKVIIPVDFSGFPCNYDEINELVNLPEIKKLFVPNTEEQKKLNRILVLSDAAHSFGATYKGKKTGTLTDASVFSFHAVKNLTTAEGGAIALNLPDVFDNKEIYNTLCIKSLHGQNKDALAKTQKGNWRYDIVEAGFKYNMSDLHAALGLIELKYYEKETLPARKHIFDYYTKEFSNHAWAEIPAYETENKTSSYHVYALRIKNISESQRDLIIQKIFDKDVSVNVHFQPLPILSFYKKLGYDIKNYPVAFNNYSREISLPVFYGITAEQLKTVTNVVISSVEEVLKNA
ncbi:MAG: DegT/DnrJ/EryC1/StrS family aminotransferase [Flavobacteriales bacterium]|nr:DegT/DnrJ/EryC1/StrS family aminotransferase [Flavobacteriales bacterium]